MKWGQYVLGTLIIAAIVHFAAIIAVPRVLMNVAMQRFGEGVGPVAGPVVGQDFLYDYPEAGEELRGPAQEVRGGWSGFVVVDLHVGHSGVVIDRAVREAVAGLTTTTACRRLSVG